MAADYSEQFSGKLIKDLPYAILDLETTGFSPYNSAITEIAMINIVDGREERYETLVDPQMHIPAEISSITGITDSMVRGKPTIAELMPEIEKRLDQKVFVSHNVPFDWGFLDHSFQTHLNRPLKMPSLCTLRLSRKLLELPSNKLGSVVEHFHVDLRNAHRAMADTQAVRDVLFGFFDVLENKGIKYFDDLCNHSLIFTETPPARVSRRS